jgi:ligand-binding sensor domain-containing protein
LRTMSRTKPQYCEDVVAGFLAVSLRFGKLLLAVFVCSISVHAQYRFDTWTADTELPHNIVRDIVQGSDGHLWLATLNGLARFDGVRFTTFDKPKNGS